MFVVVQYNDPRYGQWKYGIMSGLGLKAGLGQLKLAM